ncbi:MAG: hypothetical protein A2984_02320 [Omnitrophica WOR_2 bacterium RIFCSPLOWO2_01_FULL_41_12]|nr:MAG: hypothetical protein A2984_02320 [Omnitrophica WOR_2 bacterium RIFCSPLOWO2_01_FULL_41_12]
MLNFTCQEQRAILFLISMALVGLGVNFLAKRYSKIEAIAHVQPETTKINLNQADKETLISISGIGEKLAQCIIEYRQEYGNFNDMNTLKKVKGITDYRLDKLKDYLYVN